MHRTLLLTLAMLLGPFCAIGQQLQVQELDKYITQAMHDLEIPGLSIAIVKDDAVVLAKGYGVRKLGEPAPVDEHTLFMIGSTSKAFTTASLALLIDEGKLKWDDPRPEVSAKISALRSVRDPRVDSPRPPHSSHWSE